MICYLAMWAQEHLKVEPPIGYPGCVFSSEMGSRVEKKVVGKIKLQYTY